MLDLKELERKLDEALENETTESLNSWLLKERFSNTVFFGEGDIEVLLNFEISDNIFCDFSTTSLFNTLQKNNSPIETLVNNSFGEYDYAMAA